MGKRWVRVLALDAVLEVMHELKPCCARAEMVGEIRRLHDSISAGELLLQVLDAEQLRRRLGELVFEERIHVRGPGEPDHVRLVHLATGLPVVLHLVHSFEAWAGHLVLLTGSAAFLAGLQARAKRLGWQLDLEHSRITRSSKMRDRPVYQTERGLLMALLGHWVPPEGRERRVPPRVRASA